MKKISTVLLPTAILAGSLFLSACGSESKDTTWLEGAEGETVVTINGRAIKDSELDAISQVRMQQRQPALSQEKAIEEVVNLELLREEAVKQGYDKKPEVITMINRQMAQTLASALLGDKLDNMEISDEELKAVYDEEIKKAPSAEYNSSHILVKEEDEAKAIIADLDGGADFATLAGEKSIGPSKANGGSLNWASPATFVPEFSEAMVKLEVGSYTKAPVKTSFGWHIILLNDKRAPQPPKFEDIKPQVRQMAVGNKVQDYLDSLRNAATIEVAEAEVAAEPTVETETEAVPAK